MDIAVEKVEASTEVVETCMVMVEEMNTVRFEHPGAVHPKEHKKWQKSRQRKIVIFSRIVTFVTNRGFEQFVKNTQLMSGFQTKNT